MIKSLVGQGWSKNEIIYEIQRIFGNDVLITPQCLSEERSLVGRAGPFVLPLFAASVMFIMRRRN